MDREYVDDESRRLATDPEFRPARWSDQDLREFHRLVQCVRAAHLEDDLRNMRLLQIEPDLSGDRARASATLTSGRTIALTFKYTDSHCVVVVGAFASEKGAPQ